MTVSNGFTVTAPRKNPNPKARREETETLRRNTQQDLLIPRMDRNAIGAG